MMEYIVCINKFVTASVGRHKIIALLKVREQYSSTEISPNVFIN